MLSDLLSYSSICVFPSELESDSNWASQLFLNTTLLTSPRCSWHWCRVNDLVLKGAAAAEALWESAGGWRWGTWGTSGCGSMHSNCKRYLAYVDSEHFILQVLSQLQSVHHLPIPCHSSVHFCLSTLPQISPTATYSKRAPLSNSAPMSFMFQSMIHLLLTVICALYLAASSCSG